MGIRADSCALAVRVLHTWLSELQTVRVLYRELRLLSLIHFCGTANAYGISSTSDDVYSKFVRQTTTQTRKTQTLSTTPSLLYSTPKKIEQMRTKHPAPGMSAALTGSAWQ